MSPALIFDCDGVLADTERDGHLPAFNATFSEYGLPVHWAVKQYAELVKIAGGKERLTTLFDGPLRGTKWDGDAAVRAANVAAWHHTKTEKYVRTVTSGVIPARPGVHRLAAEAAKAGWRLAVASTSAEESVRAVLVSAVGEDLARSFSIFAGDIVPHKKPAPDIYLLALSKLYIPADEAIVVEDSGVGCSAATAAGVTTIVTTSTFTTEDDFSAAALVVSSLGEPSGSASADTAVVTLGTLRRLLLHAATRTPPIP